MKAEDIVFKMRTYGFSVEFKLYINNKKSNLVYRYSKGKVKIIHAYSYNCCDFCKGTHEDYCCWDSNEQLLDLLKESCEKFRHYLETNKLRMLIESKE